MIVDERFSCYMNSLDPGHSPFLENLEQEAKAAYVPIIRRQMQSFLRMFLTMQQPKKVLEVGTAVGFSAILMCEYLPADSHITTIENYAKRIPIARENFERSGISGTGQIQDTALFIHFFLILIDTFGMVQGKLVGLSGIKILLMLATD